MKRLCLAVTVIAVSACGGGGASSTTGGSAKATSAASNPHVAALCGAIKRDLPEPGSPAGAEVGMWEQYGQDLHGLLPLLSGADEHLVTMASDHVSKFLKDLSSGSTPGADAIALDHDGGAIQTICGF